MPKTPAKASSRKAKPTPQDERAAERLKALWDARGKGKPQALVAELLGVTQPAISQYVLGDIPLNFRALLAFSAVLGVEPEAIRTDLPEQALLGQVYGSSRPERLDDDTMSQAVELLHLLADARPDDPRFARPSWATIKTAAKIIARAEGGQREVVATLLEEINKEG